MRLKTIFPILLLLTGSVAILPAATVAPEKEPTRPNQPFLVELLDSQRGKWIFADYHGQRLSSPNPVALIGGGHLVPNSQLEVLLDHPEFPGNAEHAELLRPAPLPDSASGEMTWNLQAGVLTARLTLRQSGDRIFGELTGINLGDVAEGTSPIPVALYLKNPDGTRIPLYLAGSNNGFKIETDRIGSVFTEKEPVELKIISFGDPAAGNMLPIELSLVDYHTQKQLFKQHFSVQNRPGTPTETSIVLPIKQFGSFQLDAASGERTDSLRITRIPEPQKLDPERSFVGMNIFQQQIPYWTYQLPLFAKAGVRWVRPWLHWENAWSRQSPQPGEFKFDGLDMMMRRLEAYHQKYEYVLYGIPKYIGVNIDYGVLDEEGFRNYELWLETLAKRYLGRIREYEVHNEPDLMSTHNSKLSGEYYAELVRRSSDTLKKIDPEIRIHTLSHSNCEMPWLKKACAAGVARWTDVVTLHSYAAASGFTDNELARQQILDRNGLFGKPQWFNEIGLQAHDYAPGFSEKYKTSEARQARELAMNYAQAIAFGGKGGKVFWFCSYDPCDAYGKVTNWNTALGICYLGFQPKSLYAALAAFARLLDGRECIGYAEPAPALRQVSFSGPAAIAWSFRPGIIPATALGCAPTETIQVFDLFGNPIASGPADQIRINFTADPVYLLGSTRMAAAARAAQERALQFRKNAIALPEPLAELNVGETRDVPLNLPPGSQIQLRADKAFPAKVALVAGDAGSPKIRMTAAGESGCGMLGIQFQTPDGATGTCSLAVTAGERHFIRNGGFNEGNLSELNFEWYSPCMFDPNTGATTPGSLKFDGPFDARFRFFSDKKFDPSKDLHLSVRIRGKLIPTDILSFNIAFCNDNQWLCTWNAADTRQRSSREPSTFPKAAVIPIPLPNGWTELDMTLPAQSIPDKTNRIIYHIDLRGGVNGSELWFDDLKLYQKISVSK